MTQPLGRPRKPPMTDAEALATAGMTTREAASLISALRGANRPGLSLAAYSRIRVSEFWVRREILARKGGLRENLANGGNRPMRQNQDSRAIGLPEPPQEDLS